MGFSRAAMLLRTGLPLARKALLLPGSRCLRSPYDVAQVRRSAIPGAVAPMIGHHEGLVDWTSTLLPRGLAGRSLLHHPGCLGKRPNPYSRPVGLLGNTMWNGYSREVSCAERTLLGHRKIIYSLSQNVAAAVAFINYLPHRNGSTPSSPQCELDQTPRSHHVERVYKYCIFWCIRHTFFLKFSAVRFIQQWVL
uniref:Putative secreted protein n=1 Tax=Ixodes ricinus TaxID=34613 RepID=A0A6B0V1P6_IXORI